MTPLTVSLTHRSHDNVIFPFSQRNVLSDATIRQHEIQLCRFRKIKFQNRRRNFSLKRGKKKQCTKKSDRTNIRFLFNFGYLVIGVFLRKLTLLKCKTKRTI